MLTVNADGYIIAWSAQLKEITGFSREEVVGMQLLDLMTDPLREPVADFVQNSRAEVASRPLPIPFFSKAGEEVGIVLSVSRNDKALGKLTLAVVLADVLVNASYASSTYSVKVEATAGDEQPLVRIALDENGCVTEWNENAEELTLFLREEVTGMKFLRLINKPVDESVARMIHEAQRGLPVQPQRLSIFTKSAEELDVMFSAQFLSGRVVIGMRLFEDAPDQTYKTHDELYRNTLGKGSVDLWNCDTCDSFAKP